MGLLFFNGRTGGGALLGSDSSGLQIPVTGPGDTNKCFPPLNTDVTTVTFSFVTFHTADEFMLFV